MLSAVMLQIIGTGILIAARVIDCGALYIQCVQQHGALNIVTLATAFLLFWAGLFGAFDRVGALFFSGIFLAAITIADILFLTDGVTGSSMYRSINEKITYPPTTPELFTTNFFIYNIWLLVCLGFVITSLYKTVAELRRRAPEFN